MIPSPADTHLLLSFLYLLLSFFLDIKAGTSSFFSDPSL